MIATLDHNPPNEIDRSTLAARLGMILFLASEAMFFLALVSSFLVLRSNQPELYASHSHALDRPVALVATAASIVAAVSIVLALKLFKSRYVSATWLVVVSVLCNFIFLGCITVEWKKLLTHHTLVIRAPRALRSDPLQLRVLDGTTRLESFDGVIADAQSGIDPYLTVAADVQKMNGAMETKNQTVNIDDVVFDITYGPWKSTFFAWFFLVTGVHAVHVVGGGVALSVWLVRSMKQSGASLAPPVATTAFICFFTLVWLALFPLIYL